MMALGIFGMWPIGLVKIRLYDIYGRRVLEKTYAIESSIFVLKDDELRKMSNGAYVCCFETAGFTTMKKIIKVR